MLLSLPPPVAIMDRSRPAAMLLPATELRLCVSVLQISQWPPVMLTLTLTPFVATSRALLAAASSIPIPLLTVPV